MLPLLLTGNARIWYTASPHLYAKSFDTISEALVTQFYNESDRWLLWQQLSNGKQGENESATEFALEIRQLCQRLDVPAEESVNYLLNGLKPELRSYAMLQRPQTFAETETHTKVKEASPEEKPKDRKDETLQEKAKLKTDEQPKLAAYDVPSSTTNTPRQGNRYEKTLGRDEITQIIRQELRRSRNQQSQGQDYRNRRTFDGRPICNYCRKPGHVPYVFRKRQFDNRDPRILVTQNRQDEQSRGQGGNSARSVSYGSVRKRKR